MSIKVYAPEIIKDVSFPQEDEAILAVTDSSSGGKYSPSEITNQPFPIKKVAQELLSSSLNTKSNKILAEFQFTKMGAIQIGKYEEGTSGDLKLSPNGIVGRNSSGITTFAIDGTTGDASFLGTINASVIIASEFQAGTLSADNILTGQIDVGVATGGAYVRIDGANNRIMVHDGSFPRIVVGNA